MKNLKILILCTALFAIGFTLNSCGDQSKKSTNTEQTDQMGKEYTSAYICPMHCEGSGSDVPGKCPVCNMDYVQNEAHHSDGHKH